MTTCWLLEKDGSELVRLGSGAHRQSSIFWPPQSRRLLDEPMSYRSADQCYHCHAVIKGQIYVFLKEPVARVPDTVIEMIARNLAKGPHPARLASSSRRREPIEMVTVPSP